ncbi:hypothetical protein F2Q68_00008781 [Brassica cretica]|uniref:Uncharacterized protein n=1 Tax=Brassica cretica TaxID=69181 RepID=A0A8S9L0A7_BRACR|nr:hypothetical protein F2Q68_00008781 [Brassica cretica]
MRSRIKKREKEKRKMDSPPKGVQFSIPSQVKCPPAPARGGIQQNAIQKRRKISTPAGRLTSVNIEDLNTFFSRTHT